MPIINLKQQYPHLYNEILLEVSDPIFEVYERARKDEDNYNRRRRYHHAYYSLDAYNSVEHDVVQCEPSPEALWVKQQDKVLLREALNHLPPVQARRVYAHYLLGMKKKDIAMQEGVSRGCIGISIQKGLQNLKSYLEHHAFNGEE